MWIVFLNGHEMASSWHEMRGLLWHPLFVAMVFAISVVISVLRPYGDLVAQDAMSLTLFYANGVVSFMALLAGALFGANRWGLGIYSF